MVAYELTEHEVLSVTKRVDSFKFDPDVTTGSATLSDYKGSTYDRGHLAPAADMKMSSISMSDSFYMSNISPQIPGFNRGIWMQLEELVRTWAIREGSLFIVTGPVLNKEIYPTIGVNEVAIPELFYKALLDYSGDEIKGIGFILPNETSSFSLEHYTFTIDEVEEITLHDFFHNLPDDIENEIESEINILEWFKD